jgi:hypothetical protein
MLKRQFKILQGVCPANVDNECKKVGGNCEFENCPEAFPAKCPSPRRVNTRDKA